jgi:AraC-like DNA-binding protein
MAGPPDNFLRLSTDDFSERERFDAARELFGRAIIKIDFEPLLDVPFRLDMTLRALPDFGLACGRSSPLNCVHPPSMIDSDDLVLVIIASGGGLMKQRGREAELRPGRAVLSCIGDPGNSYLPADTETINFRFKRDRLSPLIHDWEAALLSPMSTDMEAVRLLVSYAGIFKDEHALTTPELRSVVATHLHDLAALAIGATRDAAAIATHRGVRAARLRAIKADILDNLGNKDLSIDALAARHGVTPRYVSMLFESEPLTFSEFVLGRRLHRAHRMLGDPRFAALTISAIALEAGFGDISYFNRTFRRAYGATPSDVRATALRGKY